MSDVLTSATLIALGATEGFAFATCGMSYPSVFRGQMNFSRNILIQLFLSAVGSSMITQGLLNKFAPQKFAASRNHKAISVGFPRVVGGCMLIGAGMAIAGSGPTMLPTQLGVSMTSGLAVLLGGIAGGATYALLEKIGVFGSDFKCKDNQATVLEQVTGGSYSTLAISLGSALLAADILVVPKLLPTAANFDGLPSQLITSPIATGILIGINQIPLRLLTKTGRAGSRSIMNIVATITGGKLAGKFKISGLASATQLIFLWIGTMSGAALASRTLELPPPKGYTIAESFIGGFLMFFGSRIANGCTCGHGVTGFSELGLQSMAGAAAIFAAGIAVTVFGGLKV
eukprot:CAMPEP_0176407714 /NCGR_PEP_ID=MMETSP0127-20121128/1558_1 /TAXON_ID=938130 /ORGANISM="Platyophrya macrostoma, Strain WH" /LENGTH=343 /DNA_ID=CAMNT_0017786937 /DNA_START=14 /DNA_END=1045 /DNA_ORIENTATION=+